ncbi:hypothetical protein ATEIFO6365_0004058800 [Aspergillus terreus]|uniref:Uncharacterized protein n=1 Tax=Aspergillus terreus TaxID=33178 RepID=A0A5M3YPT0_ASPTE|nr:hypothetical protein ATETN484_0002061300 [Aspergillus terreus]GFF15469.1 hypothetical protein ATEIFO6365_0004058800 [Aspergillus terreus]
MNPTPSYLSPVKDGRRILGEKTPNACLSPRHATSPSKRSRIDTLSSPKTLLPSPLFAGQKRSIDQVHSDVSLSKPSDAVSRDPRTDSQPVPARDDARSQIPPQEEITPQQQPDAMDTQTPSDQQPQQQHDTTDTHPSKARDTRTVPEDPETRKLFIQEKASLLRNRLQSAMRHVRDPQFDRRLSQLEEHSRKYPRLSLPEPTTPRPQTDTLPTPRGPQPAAELKPSSAPNESAPSSAEDPMKTPTQQTYPPRRADAGAPSPMQLSSPPADGSPRETKRDGADPPSQRGDAVDGLLKLMKTGDQRRDATWSG